MVAVSNASASLSWPRFHESRATSSIWKSGSRKVGCRDDAGSESCVEKRVELFRNCLTTPEIQRNTVPTMRRDKFSMLIFSPCPQRLRKRSPGENAMERISPGCWMRPSGECVDVSQKVTVRFVEYAMYAPCFGRVMHESSLLSGTGHSESADPEDASNRLILPSDNTKRWSLNQVRPLFRQGVTATLMSTSTRPSNP